MAVRAAGVGDAVWASTGRDEGQGPPRPSVVLVGASSGGLQSLRAVLAPLPADFSVPIVVAQHMERHRTSRLPTLLARHVRVRVVEAVDGAQLHLGTVHVVPPGLDLSVGRDGRVVLVPCRDLPPVCPSIDRMFSSVASGGVHVVAVVLTGTGRDGALGVEAVRRAGGTVLVEDARTATFDGMPLASRDTGMVDAVLSTSEIASTLTRMALRTARRDD